MTEADRLDWEEEQLVDFARKGCVHLGREKRQTEGLADDGLTAVTPGCRREEWLRGG